jgi:hypothetical protein
MLDQREEMEETNTPPVPGEGKRSAAAPPDAEVRIPGNPATQSGGKRPPEPEHGGHPCRSEATLVGSGYVSRGGGLALGVGAWRLL